MWWNGRHRGLKIPCPHRRAGSSPAIRTLLFSWLLRFQGIKNSPFGEFFGLPVCSYSSAAGMLKLICVAPVIASGERRLICTFS